MNDEAGFRGAKLHDSMVAEKINAGWTLIYLKYGWMSINAVEVWEWIAENLTGDYCRGGTRNFDEQWLFEKESDAMLVTLRWKGKEFDRAF